jgi:hypothetical protein
MAALRVGVEAEAVMMTDDTHAAIGTAPMIWDVGMETITEALAVLAPVPGVPIDTIVLEGETVETVTI